MGITESLLGYYRGVASKQEQELIVKKEKIKMLYERIYSQTVHGENDKEAAVNHERLRLEKEIRELKLQ